MRNMLRYLSFIYLPLLLLFASSGYAQNSIPFHTVDGECIWKWLVLGPFSAGDMEGDFPANSVGEGNTVTAKSGKTLAWKVYKSGADYINLQDVMKEFLFSTDVGFLEELDNWKEPSRELRQAFEDNGFKLSQKARIAIENKGSRWWMMDKENPHDYIILKEEENLKVYREPKNMTGYVACNILSPKAQNLEMVIERFNGVKVWIDGSVVHSTPKPNRWDTERFVYDKIKVTHLIRYTLYSDHRKVTHLWSESSILE